MGIGALFHYVPLHSSPAGLQYARCGSEMSVTEDVASSIVRLPLWVGMGEAEVSRVVSALQEVLGSID